MAKSKVVATKHEDEIFEADESIGKLIAALADVEAKRDALLEKAKPFDDQADTLRGEILLKLREQKLMMVRHEVAKYKVTVYINEQTVPAVKDWKKFYQYVLRSKNLQLFERRVSKAAWEEVRAKMPGKRLPGVDAFEKASLVVRYN